MAMIKINPNSLEYKRLVVCSSFQLREYNKDHVDTL